MISVDLARKLRDGGLQWKPGPGDRFVVTDVGMDGDVFTLSDMTVEVHEYPNGRVIGFNGTVEWALDSVEQTQTVWLPSEGQLRERLAATFRRLEAVADGWRVVITVAGREIVVDDPEPADAYGQALLYLVTGEEPSLRV